MQLLPTAGVANNKNEDFLRLEQGNHEDTIPYNNGEARPMKREYELMRQNPIAYARFVNQFASSVIGTKNWGYEGDNPMRDVVRGTTPFNEVITASDEAFMLVCMESYRERWLAEAKQKHALVRRQNPKRLCHHKICYVTNATRELTNFTNTLEKQGPQCSTYGDTSKYIE